MRDSVHPDDKMWKISLPWQLGSVWQICLALLNLPTLKAENLWPASMTSCSVVAYFSFKYET